jgi:hypothetical protein
LEHPIVAYLKNFLEAIWIDLGGERRWSLDDKDQIFLPHAMLERRSGRDGCKLHTTANSAVVPENDSQRIS